MFFCTLRKKIVFFNVLFASLCLIHSASHAINEIEIVPVTKNIHLLISPQGGNVVVSTGNDGAFIIDDQLAIRNAIIEQAIKELHPRGIQFILNTHYHFDHTGNNEFFGKTKAIIVAHDQVLQRLSTDQFISFFNKKLPALSKEGLPVITFSSDLSFHYNDDEIAITHIPAAHTDGDAIAFFKKANVLVAGDIIFNGLYPFIDQEHGGSVHGILAALKKLTQMVNAQTKILPGHGPMMHQQDLINYQHILLTITNKIAEEIQNGKTLEQVIASKPTQDFDQQMQPAVVSADNFISMVYQEYKNKLTK